MSAKPAGNRPLLIGICGGSASGKSELSEYLKEGLGGRAAVICQDWYYRDHSHRSPSECARVNFDHPNAIENPLFLRQLASLVRGRAIEAPIYDYASHTRARRRRSVLPAPVVIVEGLFILHESRVREQLDLSVYIEVPDDERLLRRVRRDVKRRRVDLDETLRLYETYVRPMHAKFIQPSAAYATWRWHQLEDRRFPDELLREAQARAERV